ncbi:MAG: nucleoside deaminase [Clostridia bacterium]|jgi:tRNA(adenine34) deaminase|nr:nucleoside deaminase [Clostridia bacterium]
MTDDIKFMQLAIELSKQAVIHGNEPFGAVLAKDGEVVFTNENSIYTSNNPTAHAEMGLLSAFCSKTGITDLKEYTLYSSCEPCYMCSGAMVWFKLGRLVYGASDKDLAGILNENGSECSAEVFAGSAFHRPEVTAGVLRDEAIKVLEDYFLKHNKG